MTTVVLVVGWGFLPQRITIFGLDLVRDVGWSDNTRRWLTAAVITLGLSIPSSFLLARQLSPHHGLWILYITYTWMGSVLTLLLALAAGDFDSIDRHVLAGATVNGRFRGRASSVPATSIGSGGRRWSQVASTALAVKQALTEVAVRNVRVQLSAASGIPAWLYDSSNFRSASGPHPSHGFHSTNRVSG